MAPPSWAGPSDPRPRLPPSPPSECSCRPMTKDDVPFGYRLQPFAEARRTSVSAACRPFGVHRSTYYRWKRQVDRHGLEMLRPRKRRRPQMPNQLPGWWRSESSVSRSLVPAWAPSASPRSYCGRSGAPSLCRRTLFGRCSAVTTRTRVRSDRVGRGQYDPSVAPTAHIASRQ